MTALLRSLWCRIRGHRWTAWMRLPYVGGRLFNVRFCCRCDAEDHGSILRTVTTEAKP